ncbi:MAG: amidohydrolase [Chloroflexi bacterium]|nr:amidohydrolase [Chloroflexota bacterium]
MIIDSHAYCFEPADSPNGYASAEEHLRWVQAGQAGHYQPAFRLRDREPASSASLALEGTKGLSSLPNVDLRIDHAAGRVVWTIEGEDYTKHYYPPNLRNCEFTPESLIGEMDYAGVDIALLHTNPMLGRDSAYLAECVQAFPDRLRSMAPVDEWRIRDDMDTVIEELTTAITVHGLHAIKFNPNTYLVSPEPWDDGVYRPFWEAATSLNVPIFFSLGPGPGEHKGESSSEEVGGYLDELMILTRWMERYPDVVCSITHGFPYRAFLEGGGVRFPEAVWEPFKNPNLSIEVCFPVRIGDMFDFPYREIWPALEEMVTRIGADHLMWGTDMPFQNRHCTFRQSRDWIEKYCEFLAQEEVDLIMGGTAARVIGIEENI